jgi:hypothetical protein
LIFHRRILRRRRAKLEAENRAARAVAAMVRADVAAALSR